MELVITIAASVFSVVTGLLAGLVYGTNHAASNERDEIEKLRKQNRGLVRQVQNLANALATIRVEHPGAESKVEVFEEEVEPEPPLSQALYDFMGDIEFEDGRIAVEEQIYRLRSQGHEDSQILEIISEGDR